MVQSKFWRDLAEQFRSVDDAPGNHPLDAEWQSAPQSEIGPMVELNQIDFAAGAWSCVGADVFIDYAKQAGIALGGLNGRHPADHWLDHLALHSGCAVRDVSSNCGWPIELPPTYCYSLTIPNVCGVSARRCIALETEAFVAERAIAHQRPVTEEPINPFSNVLARNLDALRDACSWSFEELALAIGCEKRTCISHITHGVKPRPKMLREYAQVFNKHFTNLEVSVSDLHSPDYRIPPGLKLAKATGR